MGPHDVNLLMPTVRKFAVRETDVSRTANVGMVGKNWLRTHLEHELLVGVVPRLAGPGQELRDVLGALGLGGGGPVTVLYHLSILRKKKFIHTYPNIYLIRH